MISCVLAFVSCLQIRKKEGPTKKLHYLGLLFDTENMLIKKLYLLIACKNSKPKSHSESDYSILVKRTCDGGVDPITGFPPFLANRMRVSISHQVLQYGE